MQGSDGDTDIVSRLMNNGLGRGGGGGEERVGGMLERVTWKLTIPYVK